jgi:hypothetical protein
MRALKLERIASGLGEAVASVEPRLSEGKSGTGHFFTTPAITSRPSGATIHLPVCGKEAGELALRDTLPLKESWESVLACINHDSLALSYQCLCRTRSGPGCCRARWDHRSPCERLKNRAAKLRVEAETHCWRNIAITLIDPVLGQNPLVCVPRSAPGRFSTAKSLCGYLDTVSSITGGLVPKVTVQLLHSCVLDM